MSIMIERLSKCSEIDLMTDKLKEMLMLKEKNKSLRKGGRLPLYSNLPDVRLYHNRIWPPFTPKSWAVNLNDDIHKYVNDFSDE